MTPKRVKVPSDILLYMLSYMNSGATFHVTMAELQTFFSEAKKDSRFSNLLKGFKFKYSENKPQSKEVSIAFHWRLLNWEYISLTRKANWFQIEERDLFARLFPIEDFFTNYEKRLLQEMCGSFIKKFCYGKIKPEN